MGRGEDGDCRKKIISTVTTIHPVEGLASCARENACQKTGPGTTGTGWRAQFYSRLC